MDKFVILSSNYTDIAGIEAEHGLSLAILTDNKKIVFDTGQSDLFIRNSQKMGFDITNSDVVVISHNHYDHTGGLGAGITSGELYYPPDFGHKCFRQLRNGIKSIGSTYSENHLLSISKKCVPLDSSLETVFGNIIATGSSTEFYKSEDCNEAYYLNELSLVISKTLFLGCCHTGISLILKNVKSLGLKIDSIVGGFHTKNMPLSEIENVVFLLKSYDIKRVLPFHCSGFTLHNELIKSGIDSIYPSTGNSFNVY